MNPVARWFWYLLPANPIVVRVVQGGSRRMRHFWIRMAYLGVLTLLMLFGLMSGDTQGQIGLAELAKAGTKVFTIVAYGQIMLICLIAPLFMAGAISDEQQEANFDILLTTPLSNLQIVLGSLVGRLFFVLSLIASGLPLFAVLMMVGGVPVSSVFVAFAVAALVAVMVGAVAITLAVLRQGGRKAVYVFMISIVGYLIVVYAADQLIRYARATLPTPATAVADADAPDDVAVTTDPTANATVATTGSVSHRGKTTLLTPLHPVLVLEASLNRADYQPYVPEDLPDAGDIARFYYTRPLGTFAVITCVLSGALLLWTALRVRVVGAGETGWLYRVRRRVGLAAPIGDKRRIPRTVWQNPIAWREAVTGGTAFGRVVARWGFFAIGMAGGILLLWLYHSGALPDIVRPDTGKVDHAWLFRNTLQVLVLMEIGIIAMVAIYMSAGAVSREREDGTLDLILTTPVTPKYYIWGKLRGLVSFLLILIAVPVLTLIIVAAYVQLGYVGGWQDKVTIDTVEFVGFGGSGSAYDDAVYFDEYGNPIQRPGTGSTTRTFPRSLLLPEAVLLLPMLVIPFIATCVVIGLYWSLKSRTVLAAVVWTVGIAGLWAGLMGFCGYAAAMQVPFIGPMINAFSPATNVLMIINPWEHVQGFVDRRQDPTVGRVGLFLATLIAAAVYAVFIWSLIGSMTKGFDQTVRRLSGASG